MQIYFRVNDSKGTKRTSSCLLDDVGGFRPNFASMLAKIYDQLVLAGKVRSLPTHVPVNDCQALCYHYFFFIINKMENVNQFVHDFKWSIR